MVSSEDIALPLVSEVFGHRPTWAEIDLDALASNFQFIRGIVGRDVNIMAVVKANAYGHGAAACAQRLAREGADWFAVALAEEGIELRRAGVRQPILCFGGFWKGQEETLIEHELTPVVYRLDMIESLNRAAGADGRVLNVHLEVDTGMGRLGVRYDEVAEFASALDAFKNIRIDGVMTHFAAADEPERVEFTKAQAERFRQAVAAIRERGHNPTYEELSNSAAIYAHPFARGNMVRPGGMLYGLWRDILPPNSQENPPLLRPVMSLRSRIILIKRVRKGETLSYNCTFEAAREMKVATLPIGYEDGYMRALSNRGRAILRGQFVPVVGRISMDFTLIDVTDIEGVEVGEEVTLLGKSGALELPAEDLAKQAETLSYEVTCGISRRVPRYYKGRKEEEADGRRQE